LYRRVHSRFEAGSPRYDFLDQLSRAVSRATIKAPSPRLRWGLSFSSILLSAVSFSSVAHADPAGAHPAAVDEAIAALRAITTMRADFVQTDANGGRLNGTLTRSVRARSVPVSAGRPAADRFGQCRADDDRL
jgi:hypothetical protein